MRVVITFNTDNESFDYFDGECTQVLGQARRILREFRGFEEGEAKIVSSPLMDSNGNHIGKVEVETK